MFFVEPGVQFHNDDGEEEASFQVGGCGSGEEREGTGRCDSGARIHQDSQYHNL